MDYEEQRGVLNNKSERDVEMAREYCDEHEFFYKTHTCEPTWEKENQKVRDAFIKKRNKVKNHTPKKYKKK